MSFAQDQNAAVLLDGTFVKEMVNKQEDAGGRIVETVTYVDQGVILGVPKMALRVPESKF